MKGLDSEQKLEHTGTELIPGSWTRKHFTHILPPPVLFTAFSLRVGSNMWLVRVNWLEKLSQNSGQSKLLGSEIKILKREELRRESPKFFLNFG